MTRNLFEGKNVLVVGGNSGIGLAAAKAFSQEGANLIITGRNVETLTSKADEIGGRTSAYQCDVTDMEKIKDLVVKVELEFGYIDVLFISAGQYSSGSINSVTEENWDWLMDTNLKGMFFMKDYTLMFVIIDDLIDEVEKIEETLIINHTLN